jgi:isoleucyl-tRNA synthetase
LILAEKRLGEFVSRIDHTPGEPPFKTLLAFGGDSLAGMKLKNPLQSSDRSPNLDVVVYNQIKPTFGTGINTITPAHDIDDLRISYAHDLDRKGAVDAESGFLTNSLLTEE